MTEAQGTEVIQLLTALSNVAQGLGLLLAQVAALLIIQICMTVCGLLYMVYRGRR